mmetsp:Transcript_3164/g.8130  ORF Transcript_3164/g.8130 Transcript_3164/m.8130 type:complete len:319 (-) Transcript_3164:35-991(-)
MTFGSTPHPCMARKICKPCRHTSPFSHELMAVLYVNTSASTSFASASRRRASATSHCEHFSDALMAALYAKTSGASSSRSKARASSQWKPFSDALMAALYVIKSGSSSSRRVWWNKINARSHSISPSHALIVALCVTTSNSRANSRSSWRLHRTDSQPLAAPMVAQYVTTSVWTIMLHISRTSSTAYGQERLRPMAALNVTVLDSRPLSRIKPSTAAPITQCCPLLQALTTRLYATVSASTPRSHSACKRPATCSHPWRPRSHAPIMAPHVTASGRGPSEASMASKACRVHLHWLPLLSVLMAALYAMAPVPWRLRRA